MKNNKLKSTLMLMTAVMGLSIAVPTFTSVGSDVTAQASVPFDTSMTRVKHPMNRDIQLSIAYWLNDNLTQKQADSVLDKVDVAYSDTYAKTKSDKKSMAAAFAALSKFTGVKISSTGHYSDSAKIDKSKVNKAVKAGNGQKNSSAAVASIVKTHSKKTTTKKKSTKKSTKKAKKATKKVYSLKATKTSKNAKKIKITGKYKGSKTTKYVHVHTYKTNNWVKLSKKRTFSVKVKANHAKHVWVYGANRKTVKHSHKKATYKYSRASKSTVATIKVVKAATNK